MPEVILLLALLFTVILYRRYLHTRITRIFCIFIASFFLIGHGMNIIVIRANGGKMPVTEEGIDWANAPSLNLPNTVDDAFFENYLPKMQKVMLLTDEPHRIILEEDFDKVRVSFLADKYPIIIGGRQSLYSLGDVFIAGGFLFFFLGIFPVWLIARRSKKNQTS